MSTQRSAMKSLRIVIGLAALASAFIPSLSAYAQSIAWPQFRGPESNPVGTNARLAERWSKTENVEWSQVIPGRGWSSPIVTGGKIYLTAATTVRDRLNERDFEMPHEVKLHYFLYCLNLKSGKVEWQQEFFTGQPPGGRHRKNSYTSESPVADGKFVYVYVGNLGLWAFDLKGKQVWMTPLEANPIYHDFGTGSSPALIGNQLIVMSDNEKQQYIAAFDKQTGKQTYKTGIDPATTAFTTSPWIYNGKLFCLSEEGQTFVIAAGETFKLLHVNALDEIVLASPAIVGERLLVRTETKLYSIRRKI